MYNVLIVEDDPMVAMINKQYVSRNPSFRVCEICRDGEAAWTYLAENDVALVILDVYMPRTDGLELLRRIRRSNLPVSVIMVTAAGDSASIEEAIRLGIVDYLIKPFFNTRFQQALEKFLSIRGTLEKADTLSQRQLDMLMNTPEPAKPPALPKGIQEKTLDTVCRFFESNPDAEFTSESIADSVGLSRVTIRRYMNYLIEKNDITGRMNYDTGGRPCMLYRRNK